MEHGNLDELIDVLRAENAHMEQVLAECAEAFIVLTNGDIEGNPMVSRLYDLIRSILRHDT